MAEAASDDLLQQGRSVIGGLAGMAAADVAFVESAQAALVALLTGWRLPAGSRVACVPGEYAPNVAQLRAHGLRPVPLPVDGIGRADVEGVARLLADDPPSFVHLVHIPSQRGVLQPAAEIAALCRRGRGAAGARRRAVARARRHRPRRRRRLRHVPQVAGRPPRRRRALRPTGARRPAHRRCCPSPRACRRCARSSPARRTSRAGSGSSWRSASTSPRDPTACANGWRRSAGPPASCSTASRGGG